MNIKERIKQAKKDIDDGCFDKPLHKNRMAVSLLSAPGIKPYYGFKGKKTHEAPHTSRWQPHNQPASEDIPPEMYGTPENRYNHYS
jgi:hypothetical protein